MKTRLAVVVLVAFTVLVGAFAITRKICLGCSTEAPDRLRNFAALSEALLLKPQQIIKAKALYDDYSGRMNECCTRHCAARTALADEMLKAGPDSVKVRVMIEQMSKAQMESDIATADYISRVREVLAPEQSEKLGQLVNGMLSGACPMGRHGALSFTAGDAR